jgi:arylsulfotransferase ASST
MTRRRLIALGSAAGASLLLPRGTVAALRRRRAVDTAYVSRPDLNPPVVEVVVPAQGTAPGYLFLAPFDISAASGTYTSTPAAESHSGPLIVDEHGEPVWFLPQGALTAMGLRVQQYEGRDVLTWYEGTVLGPYGGDFVVYDPTYHQVLRVKAGRGRHGDLHEILLTPQKTALISIYREITADLTSVGGALDGRLVEGIVQEIDVATGRVVFEWRSAEHVGLDESNMTDATRAGNVDYFHLNSIDVDTDGHLLVSARHTSAVYKVHRRTGAVIWRLGGTKSDFSFAAGASFAYQHDARRQPDGTLTLFDNNAAVPGAKSGSRGMRVALDMKKMRASLVQEWVPGDGRTGWAMGNVQQLADGGALVGWGTDGSFSEFDKHGALRFDARFADGQVGYRAFRFEWSAEPAGEPAMAVRQNGDGTMTVYASWNGATGITHWQVRTGKHPSRMTVAVTHRRHGFETAMTMPSAGGYLSVVAVGAAGQHLGSAQPIPL